MVLAIVILPQVSEKMRLNVAYCTQSVCIGRGAAGTRVGNHYGIFISIKRTLTLRRMALVNKPTCGISVTCHMMSTQFTSIYFQLLHPHGNGRFNVSGGLISDFIFCMNECFAYNNHKSVLFFHVFVTSTRGNDIFFSRTVGPELLSWINLAHRISKSPSWRPRWTILSYIPGDPTCTCNGYVCWFVASNHMW